MNKKILTVITIILLTIGVGNGLLILFKYIEQQNSRYSFIPQQQALKIFWQSVNCTGTINEPKSNGAELVHVVNDTRQYFVDESNNMGDFALAHVPNPEKFGNDRYVWQIKGDCYYPDFNGIRSYVHYVDAKTGELLE